jgi:hypothetical protein
LVREKTNGLSGYQPVFDWLVLIDFDYFAALVETAIVTDMMWEAYLSAIRTLHQVSALQRVVRPATTSTSARNFLFW